MTVSIEKNRAVWTIILSRPEARNAIDPATADALYRAFTDFDRDASAAVAVFWGEGGAFCSGWDLKQAAALDDDDFFEAHNMPTDESDVPPALLGPSRLALDKPVIAAVAGPAVAGGMELALWCDFRVMEESAYFGVYCRRWGIPLIDGGTVRLPRLVGEGRAREIILTGRKVTASESLQIGLAEYVVADGESRAKAEALAHEIAEHPQICVRADRRSLNHQHGKSVHEAMTYEWYNGREALFAEGIEGAGRFGKPSGTD
jgi:enoyl-CoA hydratase